MEFGINKIGYPLVVKPRSGSVSRHVTTHINDLESLKRAIDKVIAYSPAFIIEKFFENDFVHRITMVDFDFVACVKKIPANIVGDGLSTIQEFINRKNNNKNKGEPRQKEFTLYKLVINETSKCLLDEKGYNLQSIPAKDEIVYLQKDPFLKLGGDLIEVTSKIHPDNFHLFQAIAKLFDIRLAGIDFVIRDIARSWKSQPCAILELNSLLCIEMHHFPSDGAPQNVAKAIVDLFFKYYLS